MISAIRLPRFRKPLLDMRLGFALMRDGRVPLRSKAAAALGGLAITGLVETLELPVESVIAVLLPFLGIAGDIALDGAEMVAGPLILANLLLPFIAPQDLVQRVISERSTASGTSSASGGSPEADSKIIDI